MTEDAAPTPPAADQASEPTEEKIVANRRQPCPCGSGKKFKNCHEGDPRYIAAEPGTAPSGVTAPPAGAKGTFQGPSGPPKPTHGQHHHQAPSGKSAMHRRRV